MNKTKAKPKPTSATEEVAEIVKTIFWALLIAFVIRTLLFQPYTIPSASEEPNLYTGDYIVVSKWSYGYSRHSILFSPPIFKGRIFFTPPKRGDVIVFKLPRDGHTDYIKRLIGMPGDTVQVRNRIVYINGKPLPQTPAGTRITDDHGYAENVQLLRETNPEGRSYLIQQHPAVQPADNTGVYHVPPHCYFMMGDNRENSDDSRFDPGVGPDDPNLGGCGWDSSVDLSDEPGVGFVPEDNLVGRARIVMLS
ncbi:MAG: signal peptidase I, partial [Caulobacteraceae bacterium]